MRRKRRKPINELSYKVDGIDFPIRAKIFFDPKNQNQPYSWDVSHYYQPTKDSGIYITDRVSASTERGAIVELEQYIDGFKGRVVVPNYLY